MDHPHRAFDIRHQDSSGGTALVHGSSVVADASLLGRCIPNSDETVPAPTPATSSTAEETHEQPILHSGSPRLTSALLRSERSTPSQDVSADGSDQEASESPDRKKLKLSSEATTAGAVSTAHQTAQQHDTEQSEADVSELERLIELQQNATSQPGGTHITTTTMASGGPRKAAYDNHHQGAGSTPPCPEQDMVAVAGPSTAQHGPQQSEILKPGRLIELQQNESDDDSGSSSPFRSPEVALDPHLHAPSSPHRLTNPTHEITMDLLIEMTSEIPELAPPSISSDLLERLAVTSSIIYAREAWLINDMLSEVLEDDSEDEMEHSCRFRAEE